MWALFCLVQFYNVTHERLQAIKPLAKFISFKAIVFATWWQGVGIAVLCSLEVLPNQGKFQTGLQDFLICIEVSSLFYDMFFHSFFLTVWSWGDLIYDYFSLVQQLHIMACYLYFCGLSRKMNKTKTTKQIYKRIKVLLWSMMSVRNSLVSILQCTGKSGFLEPWPFEG